MPRDQRCSAGCRASAIGSSAILLYAGHDAEFVPALAREDLSPLTVRGYGHDLELFLDWYAPKKLENLSFVDLVHYRPHLADEKGLRPAGLNRRLEALPHAVLVNGHSYG